MKARHIVAVLLLTGGAASLLGGVAGGLLRTGIPVTDPARAAWLVQAAVWHAALMIGGFFGSVIGIERAVAARHRGAWSVPLACAAAALCLLRGSNGSCAVLLVLAALAFVAVNAALWRRQRAPHMALLLASALAWLAGNVLFAAGAGAEAVLPWWFGFLVVTIAAERLEMTRLMRRRPAAQPLLYAALAGLAAAAALSGAAPVPGGLLYGVCLVALAAWLFVFDIARHTVRAAGLTRYMAVCLLSGYAWLAMGGLCWALTAAGLALRDAALHALGLGFVVSMVMGHAPVILPAVARVKLQFSRSFYIPLALLHASLAWRLAGGLFHDAARREGAAMNALALAAFATTVACAAWAWRRHHAAERSAALHR